MVCRDRGDRLGSGLITSEPEPCGSQQDAREIVAGELVEAGCDPPEVFHLAEEAFDAIALAVDAFGHGSLDDPVAWRGDAGFRSRRPDEVEEGMAVIAAVGDDMAACNAFQKGWSCVEVVDLTGREDNPDRQSALIHKRIYLGAQPPTRAADGVILAPFFPPAACWWARMMELSINAMECGDLAASVSITLIQTPALAQRLKRL